MEKGDISLSKISISINSTVIQTLKKMDAVSKKMLLVFNEDQFYSIITIGDLQRAIIRNFDLSTKISKIIDRTSKEYASPTDDEECVRKKMLAIRAEYMPVIDKKGNLLKIYEWSDFFGKKVANAFQSTIDIPVVIMAGGMGTRLRPLTNIIPKPLLPIGEKTILEVILKQFEKIGCNQFYISINYKGEILKYYLDNLPQPYNVEYFREEKPLGTIGSVSLLKNKITTPFFVSNCDILIDQDFREVYDYHCNNKNDITIVVAVKSLQIPYGVIETGADGIMIGLKEKPELTYLINTGVYILQPELINEIPENQFYHVTDLISHIKQKGGKVGCFPISEKSWTDIGEWKEYLSFIRK